MSNELDACGRLSDEQVKLLPDFEYWIYDCVLRGTITSYGALIVKLLGSISDLISRNRRLASELEGLVGELECLRKDLMISPIEGGEYF